MRGWGRDKKDEARTISQRWQNERKRSQKSKRPQQRQRGWPLRLLHIVAILGTKQRQRMENVEQLTQKKELSKVRLRPLFATQSCLLAMIGIKTGGRRSGEGVSTISHFPLRCKSPWSTTTRRQCCATCTNIQSKEGRRSRAAASCTFPPHICTENPGQEGR